jgi:hypothetical protein
MRHRPGRAGRPAAPVTCNFWDTCETNGPGKPTSLRVSSTRTGSMVTIEDEALVAALAMNTPPPANETATAALVAAPPTPRQSSITDHNISKAARHAVGERRCISRLGGVLHRRTTASSSEEARDEPGDEQHASNDERPRSGLDEQADAAEDECQNEKNDEKSHVGSFE